MMSDVSGDPANLIPPNSKLRSSRRFWRVLFFLALAVAVLAVVGRFALDAQTTVGDRIARIKIDGVIATDPVRLKALQDLGDDENVKAVIVAINSPGGTTAGGEELYESISALRAKKPVGAVIGQ